ncbi:hypothetical protein [Clostridium thermobutyricum]|uniref:hypothetical protein n=1 Tax=Clostridium thermobutyricum TaxID=29372 RepID=UPI0029427D5B|nr:hypothetical protein [Clostridium thermobutyricum]
MKNIEERVYRINAILKENNGIDSLSDLKKNKYVTEGQLKTIRKNGYKYDKNLGQYILEDDIKNEVKNIDKDYNYIILKLEEMEKKILELEKRMSDEVNLETINLDNNNNLNIYINENLDKMKGGKNDLISRNVKIYSSVNSKFKKFAKEHKLYKQYDLMSIAFYYFLENFK